MSNPLPSPTPRASYRQTLVALLGLLLDSAHSFLQLFTSVVLFRLFMLINEPADNR